MLTRRKCKLSVLLAVSLSAGIFLFGCVERQLTVKTIPAGALVVLNDEEIGLSPVTVSFNWYGDYDVRISKEGYQSLKTHRLLEAPWYDKFPYDFFAQILNPKRIVDTYEWTFELQQSRQPSRQELIDAAIEMKGQL